MIMDSSGSELTTQNPKYILCSVFYRRPYISLDSVLNDFYKILDIVSKKNKLCVILGYFNDEFSDHITPPFLNLLEHHTLLVVTF